MAVDQFGNPISEPTPAGEGAQPAQSTRAEERITELSSKVELTAKERDELKVHNDTVTRERDFYKGYADVVATNPAAKDHQEEIKEKVLKGYSVEDATYAVLGKAGKLGGTAAPVVMSSPAGGSAPTAMPSAPSKKVEEMSTAEKREALVKEIAWV